MIDGKVAGVSVSNTAAADPNASPSIQVRGASSLKAGNGPLIVIDGMPGGDLQESCPAGHRIYYRIEGWFRRCHLRFSRSERSYPGSDEAGKSR